MNGKRKGRPELPLDRRRSARLSATFTTTEMAAIQAAAGPAKLPDWLRAAALVCAHNPITAIPPDSNPAPSEQ